LHRLGPGTWRHLQVRFTEKTITVFWDGMRITTASIKMFEPRYRFMLLRRWPTIDPRNAHVPFRGRMGLILHEGVVTVRNVKIEPG
jgi:hypothetical protein